MSATAPTVRPGAPSVRRALVTFLAALAALVGLVLVVASYLGVLTTSLQHAGRGEHPCLVAYAADQDDARVRYEIAPPRAVCTWQRSADQVESAVVAQGSVAVWGSGLALAVVGGATAAGLVVTNRRRARA